MIYISIFFVSWSLVAIYCLYKEGKDNKKHILIWVLMLIAWSTIFYEEIGKHL